MSIASETFKSIASGSLRRDGVGLAFVIPHTDSTSISYFRLEHPSITWDDKNLRSERFANFQHGECRNVVQVKIENSSLKLADTFVKIADEIVANENITGKWSIRLIREHSQNGDVLMHYRVSFFDHDSAVFFSLKFI
jgi:hypothetical protein